MAPRKRGREEMESLEQPVQEQSLLTRLRNFWEFANLMQYIFIFGRAMKIDEDFDIDVCLLTFCLALDCLPLLSAMLSIGNRIWRMNVCDLSLQRNCLRSVFNFSNLSRRIVV